jgi:Major Facilitator Superfamily
VARPDLFRDPAERARAIGAWAATIGLGIAIGPIAGALLLARFWWGSIFLVNVPIVAAAFAGALLLVPASKNPAAGRPDPWGAVLSIAGLGLLLWAIIEAPASGWGSGKVVGAGLASVLGAFVAWEARSPHPMLKLGFFSDRRFSVAAAAEVLGVFGLLGALFQFLQFDLGLSPLQAGLRILPMAAVLGVSAPLSPLLGRVIGLKLTVASDLAAVEGGLWQISAVRGHHDLPRRGTRPPAGRAGSRPPAADSDELRRGIGPAGRLRDRLSLQRRGAAGRRCHRRGRSRRGRHRRPAHARCPRRVHERQRDSTGRRRRRRPRRCRPGTGTPAVAGFAGLTGSSAADHYERLPKPCSAMRCHAQLHNLGMPARDGLLQAPVERSSV